MPKFTKDQIPQRFHELYKGFSKMMTEEAFDLWCENAIASEERVTIVKELPANPLKPKAQESDVINAVNKAREAVAHMTSGSATKKAVEGLADAVEQLVEG